MKCNCGHERHGERMAYNGKPRLLYNACLTAGCPCENFAAESSPVRDSIDGEISALRNEMRMMQRRHNEDMQRLRERIEGLTSRLAGHV